MADYREKILQNITDALILEGLSINLINTVQVAVIKELEKYCIDKMCTDIVIRNDLSEKILALYCGTLLTEGKSQKTIYIYASVIKKFIQDINKQFSEISPFDIRGWLLLKQQTVSMRTCENYRTYLSSFFSWLTTEEIIERNPMAKIKPIKFVHDTKFPFSDIELDKLRSSCKTLRERAELELLISSGVRVSELSELNKSDVDFNTLSLNIRNGKGGKQRITFINEVAKFHLLNYLESRRDDKECLFITKLLTRASKSSIESDLKNIGKNANVENVHPHRCRRTFATNLAKKGMDLATIQKLMGHTDINVTKLYVSLNNDYIKNQYDRYN